MIVYLVYLTVTCFFVSANYVRNVYQDNGWRPTSIEKVLELQRDLILTPNLHYVTTLQNSLNLPTINEGFEDKQFRKIIPSNEITKTLGEDNQVAPVTENLEERNFHDFIKIIQPPYKEIITVEDTVPEWDISNNSKPNQQRKAKKLDNTNSSLYPNNPIKYDINFDNKKDEINDIKDVIIPRETYKVKENIDEDNQSTSDPSNQRLFYKEDIKYVTPKSSTVNTNNNLTTNLLDILARYNIRTSDNLRNYEISLRQNSRNSQNRDFVVMHVPMKVPIRYNNANHLPINPLLAVLLSNYGHYVPSLYGVHSGYNNLYGYLASNNIHNNKPFGSYKIFSDSDPFY